MAASSSASSVATADSDEELPPSLAEYYDQTGEVSVLRESLSDLEYDRSERVLQRELLRDQEAELSESDEHFEAEYEHQRRLLRTRMHTAKTRAEAHRSQCFRQGLDIEASKWRRQRGHATSWTSRVGSGSTQDTEAPLRSNSSYTSLSTLYTAQTTSRSSTSRQQRATTQRPDDWVEQAPCQPRLSPPKHNSSQPKGLPLTPHGVTKSESINTDPALRLLYGVTAHKQLPASHEINYEPDESTVPV